ncbi:hypothetical protein [Azospirillum soli]|uniref:hypothetical protein n=1 Tax=Azospirillum soli TaxID=1304799 RepID=UPI001AE9BE83|nr:hypothetical protein [Azospirillum soli]MBP2311877.1 hypothetical protein [Azospirillum soli]
MTVRAQLHDGTVLEFPDGTSEAVIAGTVKQLVAGGFPKTATDAKPTGRTLSAGLGGQVFQGATMGLGDEVNAGSRAFSRWVGDVVTGKTPVSDALKAVGLEDGQSDLNKLYTDRLAAERADLKATEKAHPVASFGAQALGGLVAAPAGAANAFRAGTELALPAAKTGAAAVADLAKVGAGMGAVSGFGNAEGGAGDRLTKAAEGAALGGVMGVALPAALSLGGRTLGAVGSALGLRDADAAARNKVLQALARDGSTVDDVAARLSATEKPLTLADVGGENTLGLARVAANVPGTARQKARDVFETRQAGQVGRLAEDVRAGVAPGDFFASADALIQRRAAESAPLYDKALSVSPVWSERLQRFLDDPVVRGGLKEGIAIQRLESLAANKPFNPTDLAVTGFNEAGDPLLSGVPNMRTLNVIKKGLDNILEGYRDRTTGRLALDEKGRAIDAVRRAFLSELDGANPHYAAARRAWAGPTQARDAMTKGRDFVAMDAADIRKLVGGLPEGDREFYRIGVAQALRDRLYRDTAQPGQNAALRVSGEGLNEKLAAALGKDEAEALLARVKAEKDMTEVRNAIRTGSRTAPMQADLADMQVDTSILGNLLRGDVRGAGINAVQAAARRASGLNPSTANSLAGLLYDTTPAGNAAVVDALRGQLARNQANEARTSAAARAYARGVGVALPGLLLD